MTYPVFDAPDFAALVSSRICHDIISPVGAIGNGLELLELSGDMNGAEMGLIRDSLNNATARIDLFRLAFGAARREDRVAPQHIRDLCSKLSAAGRAHFDWAPAEAIPRPRARAIALALMCAETALPQGGAIRVTSTGTGARVMGKHAGISLDPELWAPLAAGSVPKVTAKTVQFALLPGAVSGAGATLALSHGPDTVSLTIT